MGSGLFGLEQFKSLINDSEIEVLGVVTQPKKEFGRKKELKGTPVYEYVSENFPKLKLVEAKNSKQIKDQIELEEADFIVVADYGVILKDYILEAPKVDCINVHGSILPKYRGASPIQSALLNGEKETGVSIMRMAEEMDAGDVYKIVTYQIQEDDVAPILYSKLAKIGGEALVEVLKDIYHNNLEPVAQDESEVTFCGKIEKADGLVVFAEETAEQVLNKYRAYYFWPKIYFCKSEKKYIIHECRILEESSVDVLLSKDFWFDENLEVLCCKTASGIIAISKIQIEGKTVMSVADFWRGHSQTF